MKGLSGPGPRSVRVRPFLLLALLGVLPILGLAVVAQALSSRAVERLVHSGNDATATMTAAFVEREFEHWAFTLTSYAGFPVLSGAVASGDVTEVERRLAVIVEENPRMDRAFVADLTGLLWADFPVAPESRGRRFDDRDWYRGVSRTMAPYTSAIYRRLASPLEHVVAMAVPVLDPGTGEPVGFLVAHVLPSGIRGVVGQVGNGATGEVILLDHTGAVVAHPSLDLRIRRYGDYESVLPPLAGTDGQITRGEYVDPLSDQTMIASFGTARVGDHRWTVVAKQPVEAAFAPTRTLALQLGGAGLLLGLVVSGLTVGLIRENTRRAGAETALEVLNRDLESLVETRTEELHRAEQELLHSRKLEAVGRLASGIAHDFNNLLTVIIASAQMLRDSVPEDSPAFRDLVDIDIAGDRAAELTRQLLAFSRKQIMKPEVMDVNDSVCLMRGILERVLGGDIELAFQLSSDLHPVKFDPGQIEQVLMNLVVNARDAMPQGGTLTIRTDNVELDAAHAAEHPGTRPGPHVVLTVADNGQGMTPETRERIFEPFFTTKELGRGTGLGLATVYGIVKQGGGHVRVHSKPERGTLFEVFLPRTEDVPGVTPAPAPPPVQADGGGTVLVVEDGDGVRRLVVRVLSEAGYTVLEAGDAEQARAAAGAQPEPLELLITDVFLPGVSGPDLARELQAAYPGLQVLFMSGYMDDAIVDHGILTDGTEFIEKPLRPRDLLARVREMMDRPVAIPLRDPA